MGDLKRVLIVDDIKTGSIYAEALGIHGFSVDLVTNGLSAMKKLEAGPYDMVITELDLPHLRGADLYLRAVERWPELENRFIYIGNNEPGDMRERAIMKGRFMRKPFPISSLIEYVEAILKRQEYQLLLKGPD
ncbi:MAG: response regulator [Candidatus Methylomirabilis sp.]|nr:response regulator [Deltaproteobacteria bacterium]